MADGGQKGWIGELRARLAQPPPRRLQVGDRDGAAVLVPLYVDAGALWVRLLCRSTGPNQQLGQIALPGGVLSGDGSPWDAALEGAAAELGLAPNQVLRIGELDELETPGGGRAVPCVGALPAGFEPGPLGDEVEESFAVPVLAFANPRMVEHRQVRIGDEVREVAFYHVGRRTIWGLPATILENLIERLGLGTGHG